VLTGTTGTSGPTSNVSNVLLYLSTEFPDINTNYELIPSVCRIDTEQKTQNIIGVNVLPADNSEIEVYITFVPDIPYSTENDNYGFTFYLSINPIS
jgi:hypothetical protein